MPQASKIPADNLCPRLHKQDPLSEQALLPLLTKEQASRLLRTDLQDGGHTIPGGISSDVLPSCNAATARDLPLGHGCPCCSRRPHASALAVAWRRGRPRTRSNEWSVRAGKYWHDARVEGDLKGKCRRWSSSRKGDYITISQGDRYAVTRKHIRKKLSFFFDHLHSERQKGSMFLPRCRCVSSYLSLAKHSLCGVSLDHQFR